MKSRVSVLGLFCSGAVIASGMGNPAHATATHHHHRHKHHEVAPEHKAAHDAGHATGRRGSTIHPATTSGKRHHRPAHHHAVPVAALGAATGAAATQVRPDTAAPAVPSVPDVQPADKGTNTGLPLPRFAAFRADKVFMRRGPGDRYPIDWVYHRRGLPVKIEREFDVWRLVEDSDGQKGWVHQATLYGSRTFVVPGLPPEGASAQTGEASAQAGDHVGKADARILGTVATQSDARSQKNDVLLMSHPEDDSSVVALLQPGTVGNIKLCPQASQWCHVVVKGYDGWLPRRLFWGLLPGEAIQPN